MVRYARAKGSKASNEKLPEDATPWKVMKLQMVEAKQPKVEPILNVNEFLKKDNSEESTTWATFEETKPKNESKKAKKIQLSSNAVSQNKNAESVSEKKKKKRKNISFENNSIGETDAASPVAPRKKIKKEKSEQKCTVVENSSEVQKSPEDFPVCVFGNKSSGSKSKKGSSASKFKKGQSKFNGKQGSFFFNLGNQRIKLHYYNGFPVKEDDWNRLTELEEKLREENVPEEQIQATMKLQRRRAEKRWANERKKVCFVCRQPGHLLSDCPSVGDNTIGKNKNGTIPDSDTSGLCYKCGSREHTHFECKVVKDASFRFARCFVCGEQGHISRQCPDNPRGLYPKGGGCSDCGDVTHFRKDCPQRQKEKQDTALTVPTLKEDDALEALDGDGDKGKQQTPKTPKKSKKVVKF